MVSRDTTKDSSPLFLCDTVRKKRMGDWESFIFPLVMFAFLIAFARAVLFVVKSLVMRKVQHKLIRSWIESLNC